VSPSIDMPLTRDYRSKYRDIGSIAGGGIGAALGGSFGGPAGAMFGGSVGSKLGQAATDAVKYFTGYGDYEVKDNIFLRDSSFMTPIINRTAGGVVIRKCEYITDIISSTSANTFKNQSFNVNPGLESTFTWLSQVAPNFEEYIVEGMYFEYRTMSADALNSVNTALGQVIMAAEYNAGSPNFANKQSMENYEGGVSCKPSTSMRYFVECQRSQTVLNELYVRNGSVPTGQDIRLYDLCNFQIATNGFQGTSVNCGELWVCYQITLRKPKMFTSLGLFSTFLNYSATYSNAAPLASANITLSPFNNIVLAISGTTLTFPFNSLPQAYLAIFSWAGGTPGSIVYPTFSGSAGMTLFGNSVSPAGGVSSANAINFFLIGIAGNSAGVLTATSGTLPTSGPVLNVFITQIPNTYLAI